MVNLVDRKTNSGQLQADQNQEDDLKPVPYGMALKNASKQKTPQSSEISHKTSDGSSNTERNKQKEMAVAKQRNAFQKNFRGMNVKGKQKLLGQGVGRSLSR